MLYLEDAGRISADFVGESPLNPCIAKCRRCGGHVVCQVTEDIQPLLAIHVRRSLFATAGNRCAPPGVPIRWVADDKAIVIAETYGVSQD